MSQVVAPGLPGGRVAIQRVGATVLQQLVEMIALGQFPPGAYLPPEQSLCDEFGVSRTVIRECVKRLQEKGMVTVAQGRGTQVTGFERWNALDPLILTTLIRNDESLGILDEVSTVRATLEAVMAAQVAADKDEAAIARIGESLQRMRETQHDDAEFREADVAFHLAVMDASGHRIAGNIARVLFMRARDSIRFDGTVTPTFYALTMAEHEAVFAAIAAGDERAARATMEDHILGSWRRRRFPLPRHTR